MNLEEKSNKKDEINQKDQKLETILTKKNEKKKSNLESIPKIKSEDVNSQDLKFPMNFEKTRIQRSKLLTDLEIPRVKSVKNKIKPLKTQILIEDSAFQSLEESMKASRRNSSFIDTISNGLGINSENNIKNIGEQNQITNQAILNVNY